MHWYRELHRIVLVDTPISAYFGECFRDENLDEVNVEILRNSLYKVTYFLLKLIENYHINLGLLERFFRLSQMLGGLTATVMKVIYFYVELDI